MSVADQLSDLVKSPRKRTAAAVTFAAQVDVEWVDTAVESAACVL